MDGHQLHQAGPCMWSEGVIQTSQCLNMFCGREIIRSGLGFLPFTLPGEDNRLKWIQRIQPSTAVEYRDLP